VLSGHEKTVTPHLVQWRHRFDADAVVVVLRIAAENTPQHTRALRHSPTKPHQTTHQVLQNSLTTPSTGNIIPLLSKFQLFSAVYFLLKMAKFWNSYLVNLWYSFSDMAL